MVGGFEEVFVAKLKRTNKMHYVYLIQSLKNGYIYVGFTKDLKKRISEHNLGLTPSIKYWRPFKLIYYECYLIKEDAVVREKYLKSGWGRQFIDKSLKHYFLKYPKTTKRIRRI